MCTHSRIRNVLISPLPLSFMAYSHREISIISTSSVNLGFILLELARSRSSANVLGLLGFSTDRVIGSNNWGEKEEADGSGDVGVISRITAKLIHKNRRRRCYNKIRAEEVVVRSKGGEGGEDEEEVLTFYNIIIK